MLTGRTSEFESFSFSTTTCVKVALLLIFLFCFFRACCTGFTPFQAATNFHSFLYGMKICYSVTVNINNNM